MPPKKRKNATNSGAEKKKRKKKTDAPNGGAASASDNEEVGQDVVLEGSMISGELLFSGGTNWDMIGRHSLPKGVKSVGGRNVWGPHRMACFKGIRVRTVVSSAIACHSVVITTEGKAYSWGRNDKAQLGHGDSDRREVPTLIESLEGINIIDAACGKGHTLLLSDRGHVYGVGDNKMGQLGLGHQSPTVQSPTRMQYRGPPIRRVACGGEFSMVVDIRGNLYSFGCPEYGQLGHNSDGKYFVSSNKLQYNCELRPRAIHVFIEKGRDGIVVPVKDVEISDVACGLNHSLCLDRKKRVYTWGFGGYGRLGHTDPKDEWIPRLLKFFEGPNRGAGSIASGSTFSMVINELSALYLWGKNKPTGDATMYPKPVHDLSGWQVRSVGCCNRSIVVAADDSVVSWGCSPTYGELGYGDNKPRSAPSPQEVKQLSGIYVHKISCGFAHTLMIARADSDQDREALDKLPDFTPTVDVPHPMTQAQLTSQANPNQSKTDTPSDGANSNSSTSTAAKTQQPVHPQEVHS